MVSRGNQLRNLRRGIIRCVGKSAQNGNGIRLSVPLRLLETVNDSDTERIGFLISFIQIKVYYICGQNEIENQDDQSKRTGDVSQFSGLLPLSFDGREIRKERQSEEE